MNKKNFKIIPLFMAVILIAVSFSTRVEAKTLKATVSGETLEAGKQFTLTNMPYNGKYSPIKEYAGSPLNFSSVQNFAYTPDGKYIFTTSECRTSGTKHTLLCRCTVPGTKSADATAECVDTLVLGRYGHGEAIDITQDDPNSEVYNLWVATTPNSGTIFGTEIARITYKVTNGKGSIVKTVKITNFRKANVVKGKAKYFKGKPKPRRLNVSIDKANNQIMFRVQFPTGKGVNYVAYDYDKLNTALNKVGNNGKYSITKAAKWQKANLRTSLVPYMTFQSFAISDNKLYVCGGHMNKGAQIYVIKYKTCKNVKKIKMQEKMKNSQIYKIYDITPQITVADKTLGIADLEIEGMKLEKDASGKLYAHVNFFMNKTPIRESIGIYKFGL